MWAWGGGKSEGLVSLTEGMDVELRHGTEMGGAGGREGDVADVDDEDKAHLRRAGVAFSSGGTVGRTLLLSCNDTLKYGMQFCTGAHALWKLTF